MTNGFDTDRLSREVFFSFSDNVQLSVAGKEYSIEHLQSLFANSHIVLVFVGKAGYLQKKKEKANLKT